MKTRWYISRRFLRSTAQVAAICFAIGIFASVVRILPWLVSPTIPVHVSCWFAKQLVVASLEVTLLLAPSLGACLEVSRFASDGSLNALMALGVSPVRLLSHVLVLAFSVAVLTLGTSMYWGRQIAQPGQLMNPLISPPPALCVASKPAQLPIANLAWLCVESHEVLAGLGGQNAAYSMIWSASSARFSDDLRSIHLHDVQGSLRDPPMRFQVRDASITGLLPWMVAEPTSWVLRSLVYSFTCLASAVCASLAMIRSRSHSRATAFVLGTLGPAIFLLLAPRLFHFGLLGVVLAASLGPVGNGAATIALMAPRLIDRIRPRSMKK